MYFNQAPSSFSSHPPLLRLFHIYPLKNPNTCIEGKDMHIKSQNHSHNIHIAVPVQTQVACVCGCVCLCAHCMFIKSQWLIPLSLCLFSVCLSSSISLSVFLFPHLWPVRHPTNSSFKVSIVQLRADPVGSVSPHCDATTQLQIH